MKYIGFTDAATALIEAVGLKVNGDDGWFNLNTMSADDFISKLRYWQRKN